MQDRSNSGITADAALVIRVNGYTRYSFAKVLLDLGGCG